MTTLTFRRPTVLPIHPKGWTRPAGNIDFVVTQDFNDPDAYYGGTTTHRAVDLGNFRCGDAVCAMHAGRAYLVQDAAGALGVVVDHGYGITTEYWHLSARSVANGQPVIAGTIIGRHGATGINIGGCHLHVECKRNGVRVDPEPLMFGGSIVVVTEGDRVKLPPNLQAVIRGTVKPGTRLRVSPWTVEHAIMFDVDTTVQVFGTGVRGQEYTLGGVKGSEYAWIGHGGFSYFVALPLVLSLRLGGSPTAIGIGGGVTSPATMQAIANLATAIEADAKKVKELAT